MDEPMSMLGRVFFDYSSDRRAVKAEFWAWFPSGCQPHEVVEPS
jgi:hypothetical protein